MNRENLKIYLIFLLALILGISVDYLFYGKPIGISFFVFISILIVFSLFLAKKFGQVLKRDQGFLLIPIILLSTGVFLRCSPFLVFFNTLGTIYLIFLFSNLFFGKKILNFYFLDYLILPFSVLGKYFQKAPSLFEKFWDLIQTKRKLGSPEFQGVVRGIIISLPILAIFIWLFASADIVFQKYLDELLKISIEPEIVSRVLIVLVSSYFFVGFFAKIFEDQKFETSQLKNNGAKFLGSIESSVILSLVSLLFLIFILIQFFYLFGEETYVWGIEEYITYSEYARKGFGELITVSIISFLLIYGIDKFGKRENVFQKRTFKILTSILVFELFIIMASAVTRLSLYVDGYGFTFSRLLSFVFLFWLFFAFLLFLYKIFSERKETLFLYSIFCLTILFLIGLNIFNPDAFIVKKNIERHIQGKQLDIRYFNQLSDDAMPEIVKIFERIEDEKMKSEIACYLIKRKENLTKFIETEDWQSFNLSKKRGLEVLQKYSKEIEKYKTSYRRLLKEQYPNIDKSFYDREWSVCLPLAK